MNRIYQGKVTAVEILDGKNKTGEDEPHRLCLRNAFEHGVFAWRTASLLIQETVCVANFVLIPI